MVRLANETQCGGKSDAIKQVFDNSKRHRSVLDLSNVDDLYGSLKSQEVSALKMVHIGSESTMASLT